MYINIAVINKLMEKVHVLFSKMDQTSFKIAS